MKNIFSVDDIIDIEKSNIFSIGMIVLRMFLRLEEKEINKVNAKSKRG